MFPSSTKSSTPVTVKLCTTFQLAALNVSVEVDSVPSPSSLENRLIVTSAVGWLVSTTLYTADPPASVVVVPPTGVIVTPDVSSSVLVTATSLTTSPL